MYPAFKMKLIKMRALKLFLRNGRDVDFEGTAKNL